MENISLSWHMEGATDSLHRQICAALITAPAGELAPAKRAQPAARNEALPCSMAERAVSLPCSIVLCPCPRASCRVPALEHCAVSLPHSIVPCPCPAASSCPPAPGHRGCSLQVWGAGHGQQWRFVLNLWLLHENYSKIFPPRRGVRDYGELGWV